MELTFDSKEKVSEDAHVMELEHVPALQIGATPPKADDADAPAVAPSAPATPLKSAQSASSPAVSEGDCLKTYSTSLLLSQNH
jgi:hypothetical protein